MTRARVLWARRFLLTAPLAAFALLSAVCVSQRQYDWSGVMLEAPALAIAVSELYHDTDGYKGYWSVHDALFRNGQNRYLDNGRFDEVLSEAISTWVSPSERPNFLLNDGNSVAEIEFFEAAFSLFGASSRSLLILYLGLMLVSVVAISVSHRQRPAVLSFVALAVLAMALQWEVSIVGHSRELARVYSSRYFSILALIPGIHLFARMTASTPTRAWDWIFDIVQTAILVFAALVRGTAYYLVLALVLYAAYVWIQTWRGRQPRGTAIRSLQILALFASTSIVVNFVLATRMDSEYSIRGVGSSGMWHRIYISSGLHPAWPFEQFECDEGEMVPGLRDANGHCVWYAYTRQMGQSLRYYQERMLSKEYEAVLRATFIRQVQNFPRKTLEAFTVYKWRLLTNWFPGLTTKYLASWFPWIAAPFAFCLIAAGVVAESLAVRDQLRMELYGFLLLAFSFTFPFAAWPAPHTSADLVVNALLFSLLTVSTVLTIAARPGNRGSSPLT